MKPHLQPLRRGGAVKILSQTISELMNEQLVTKVFVEQPDYTGSVNYIIAILLAKLTKPLKDTCIRLLMPRWIDLWLVR